MPPIPPRAPPWASDGRIVSELLEVGVINEKERVNLHTKGRRTVRYGIDLDSCYFLGIDMRTSTLNIAMSDFSGNVVNLGKHTDFRFENTYETFDNLCERVTSFIGSLEESRIDKSVQSRDDHPRRSHVAGQAL